MRYSVLDDLEESTRKFGGRAAVIDEHGTCSWQELRDDSKRAGSALLQFVSVGNPVPVFAEKSISVLKAFFGSVYAGAFYVMLNPMLPESRLLQILGVLKSSVFVTDREHFKNARSLVMQLEDPPKILLTEELFSADINEKGLEERKRLHIDTDPLYANFTSGSTGVPKGVAVGHRSVMDFIDCFTEEFGIDDTDVIANQAPFDFDVSVKDIYSALKTGATLLLVPRQLFSNPAALLDFLCEHGATNLTWAVSALCLVSTFHGLEYKVPSSIRRVLFSGEVMPSKHLHYWMNYLPDAEFVNLYGPTEITCNCTFHRIDRSREYPDGIPIGKPFRNERVFLLDGENRLIAEPGTIGEICVTGSALALGYYYAPEQTAAAFTVNPLNPAYPQMIYRTGDLAQYGENGDLFFAGRKDFQIKYQGHRIELEEIERAMEKIPEIERCCCVFDNEKERLYGFYIGNIEKAELHEKMLKDLPDYMVPGRLVRVEEMPLTKNGKTDRKALLANAAPARRRNRK